MRTLLIIAVSWVIAGIIWPLPDMFSRGWLAIMVIAGGNYIAGLLATQRKP